MKESFDQLFKESIQKTKIKQGSMINGKILSINKDIALIDTGLKSESIVAIEQFKNNTGELEVKIGDNINFILENIEDGFGETLISREKAKKYETWSLIEEVYKTESMTIKGIINGKVKGGFSVDINGIRAFLPGSLLDIKLINNIHNIEGQSVEFKVIKLDKKNNNIVVSRRAVIQSEYNIERNNLLMKLKNKAEIKGIVKNLTNYGAFIDLGGIDGLLHITDIAWRRVKHPNEILNVGDEVNVKILKFDHENNRVSLGLKQLSEDPWTIIKKQYPEGTRLLGNVTNLTDYGCFVEVMNGIEGLVHVSEIDWTNKNIQPSKIVNIGDKIEVMILNVDEINHRISLGIKQCKENPWKKFSQIYNKGDIIKGKIKSITDFGIFVEFKEGVDGLIHLSDISWKECKENLTDKYKKNEEISTVILQIDAERERISLGIKQLVNDPFNEYISINKKNSIIDGKIVKINEKNVMIQVTEHIIGNLKINSDNNTRFMNINENIKVKIIDIDHENQILILSTDIKNGINKNSSHYNIDNQKEKENFINIMKEMFKIFILIK